MERCAAMIVVTGAAGLIGSAVARDLNERGRDDLILVDHLGTSDKWMNLRSLKYYDYYEKDDFFPALSHMRSGKISAIIHLGACSSTTERNASYLMRNNFNYSVRLAEFAARYNIRMVYASSAATYGDGHEGYDDDESRLEVLRPLNAYGYSKQVFDMRLHQLKFKPSFAGIKYFNVYGPNEYHKGNMISLALKGFRQIQQEGRLKLFKSYNSEYADGEQKRDFLYVRDAARITTFLALDKPRLNGIFNAGSGQAHTWLDLARAIFLALNKEPQIEFIDMPLELRDRYQYYTCAPMEKLQKCGYDRPAMPLARAVDDYIKNYLLRDEIVA
jgi:ADP-L-glycero-D-manno-heptose 6-epimerase